MSARKDTATLAQEAGFAPGELDKSRNLRAAVCNGSPTLDQLSEYAQYSAKWSRFAELLAERDQREAVEASAPDPSRNDGDSAGVGAAFRAYRDGLPPPRIVVRTRLVQVDDGTGSLQDIPEAQPLPLYRGGSSASVGAEKIRQGFNASKKR